MGIDRSSLTVASERRMPAPCQFRENASPLELPLQQERVAEIDAIGCPELNEEAISFPMEREHNEQILKQLGMGVGQIGGAECRKSCRRVIGIGRSILPQSQ